MGPLFFQPRLLQDTVQSAWRQIVARFARNGGPTGLTGMLKLAVTSPRGDEVPPVCGQHSQYV
jgi:hypothetical protein